VSLAELAAATEANFERLVPKVQVA